MGTAAEYLIRPPRIPTGGLNVTHGESLFVAGAGCRLRAKAILFYNTPPHSKSARLCQRENEGKEPSIIWIEINLQQAVKEKPEVQMMKSVMLTVELYNI